MTPKAKKWDEKYSKCLDKHKVIKGELVPINRPCDWCGQSVRLGYIHEECLKKERDLWLDILD